MTVVKKRRQDDGAVPASSPGQVASHVAMAALSAAIVAAALQFPNRQSAMAFYGVYHRDPRNQLIHFFGVPGIIWSLFVFQCHLPLPGGGFVPRLRLPGCGEAPHRVNWATLWLLFYVAFYLSIDLVGAAMYLPFLYLAYASAVRLTRRDQLEAAKEDHEAANKGKQQHPPRWTGTGKLLKAAFYVHFLSWYAQIHFGHKVYEGAQPAVMQSLGGALTSAPLFAFYEGVWALGFMKDYHRTVLDLVDQYTRELCESGAVAMRACGELSS